MYALRGPPRRARRAQRALYDLSVGRLAGWLHRAASILQQGSIDIDRPDRSTPRLPASPRPRRRRRGAARFCDPRALSGARRNCRVARSVLRTEAMIARSRACRWRRHICTSSGTEHYATSYIPVQGVSRDPSSRGGQSGTRAGLLPGPGPSVRSTGTPRGHRSAWGLKV